MESAKEFLIRTDKKIREAVNNGYDIRLDESEILKKMEEYANFKLNMHIVVGSLPTEEQEDREVKKRLYEWYGKGKNPQKLGFSMGFKYGCKWYKQKIENKR